MTSKNKNNQKQQLRLVQIVWIMALLIIVSFAVVLLLRHQRALQERDAAPPHLTPEEQAALNYQTLEEVEQIRQSRARERMQDPVYRQQLADSIEKRRQLSTSQQAIQLDIDDWVEAVAATNTAFATALQKRNELQEAAVKGDPRARASLQKHLETLEAWMAADHQGAALLDSRRELTERRQALDLEVRRIVGARLRKQIKPQTAAQTPALPKQEEKSP